MEVSREVFDVCKRLDEAEVPWSYMETIGYTKLWFSPIKPEYGYLYRLRWIEDKDKNGPEKLLIICSKLQYSGWRVRAAQVIQEDIYQNFTIKVEFHRADPNL